MFGFFAGITPPEAPHRIGKVGGKGASEQFIERGKTREPKSTTTTSAVFFGKQLKYLNE